VLSKSLPKGGLYRTDKEVEIENKSLWQKIKEMFK
jgi:hypothetical protein